MRRQASLLAFIALLVPTSARGELRLLDEEDRLQSKQPANISTELLEPTGNTRLHLTTRASFSSAGEAFTDRLTMSFELQAFIRLTKGWAVEAALPFGLVDPESGNNQFIFGNIRVGTAAGFEVRLQPDNIDKRSARFRIGGGLDIYIPSTQTPDASGIISGADAVGLVRDFHSFEPELFIDDAMFFRVRGHAQLSFDYVILEAELGLSPGFTLAEASEGLFLVSWAARISVKPTYTVDPYVEAASSFHVTGKTADRDYDTPVWITPGVRFHFSYFDPAIFASFNVNEFAVLFGIDLAGAAREYIRVRKEDDFLEDVFR